MIDLSEVTQTGAWTLEDSGEGVFLLRLAVPDEKLNILSEAVLRDLDAALDAIERDRSVRALVIAGGKPETGTFIAGADVHEIRGIDDASEAATKAASGQSVMSKIAQASAVTVAAIHGNCLGGGTELVLACDLRVATKHPKTRIGLPEVQLGILPGFGGTQRLPRLVGIANALPMILSGKPKSAEQAAKIGLVDRLAAPGLLERDARELALEALRHGGKSYRPKRPRRGLVTRMIEGTPLGRSLIRRRARSDITRRAGAHYPAPFKALDAVIDGMARSIDEGLRLEATLVGELIASPIATNLIDLFLSSEAMRRGRASDDAVPGVAPGDRIGLLGAGVMGGGIAELLTRKGFRIRMKDIAHEGIQAGIERIRELFAKRIERRRMTEGERDGALAAITTTLDYSGFSGIRFVIEAVVENMGVKQRVLREVEQHAHADVVLASNTSSLSITEMQSALERPERLVGLHFFNPVDRMMLVEIIRGERTGDESVAAAEAAARSIGKIPVLVGDGPGFVVNRLLGPYLNEAVRLFEEGYSIADIDQAVRGFGMPMGPFELLDEIGLDVAAKVCAVLHEAFGERARPPAALAAIADSGLLGKKGGRGFWIYRHGRKVRPNAELSRLVAPRGDRQALPPRPELWLERLIYPIVNEAARTLEEGIAARAEHVDLAMVLGTGFAPFRGGPLRYADSIGVQAVVNALAKFGEPRLAPCALLTEMAAQSGSFYGSRRHEPAAENAIRS